MEPTQDLADTLRCARAGAPDRPAVVSVRDGRTANYRELDERSDRMAHALLGLGLARGDRIALWLETSITHVLLYLAAAKAGLVVIPINERYVTEEAAHILRDCGARALAFGSFAAASVDELGLDRSLVLLASGDGVRGSLPLACLELGTTRPGPPVVERRPEDPFIIGYTSGTTGRPKGAVLTHRGVLNIARTNSIAYRLPMGSVGVYTAAMTYTATVPAFILTHFYVSGTVVLSPHRDPGTVVDLIETYRANYTHVPPPLVDGFAVEFDRRHDALDSLTSVLQGAGKVPAARLAPLNEALDGRLTLGWGMTENSGGLVTATTPSDTRRALHGDLTVLESVGRPVPGTEVAVHNDDGQPLPADGATEGELVLRSSSLMAGYWTAETRRPAPLLGDWYRSGDIGTIDPGGLVRITDRRADLIVSGGMNIYPSEIEDVLRALPDVRDCAVVGVPDDRWGQAVAAFVVLRENAELTPEDVIEHCRGRLAPFKKPRHVKFGTSLPSTLSGKTKRFEIRTHF